ncbi:hypothetical protein ACWEXP_06270 [Staphylococcus pseudoxylosus]|uniref:hypothetical protein n=1 Tax=Staphylococcus pseudoxylosus TaxID=2282419 RepID=UPI0018EC9614
MFGNFTKKVLVSAVVLGSVGGSIVAYENSNTDTVHAESKNQIGEFKQINSSEANISLEKGYEYNVNDNGTASIVNKSLGYKEDLPNKAKDKDGKSVTLSYAKNGDKLKLMVIDDSTTTQTRGWKKGLKCGLGTAGGAGGGGLAGAGVGSAVPVIGTGAGAIIGGVSGGMSGAAASCF